MSREKQIEEMARIIDDNHGFIVSSVETAEALYNAGYRKQSEGEWTKFEVNSSKGYGQVYYQHKDCEINATQLFPSPYHFCPNCGAKMKDIQN